MRDLADDKLSAKVEEKLRRRRLRLEAIALMTLIAAPLLVTIILRSLGLNIEWSLKPGSHLDELMRRSPELAQVWSAFVATFTGNIGQLYAIVLLTALGVVLFYFVGRLAIVLGGDLLARAVAPIRRFVDALKGTAGAVAGAAADAAGAVAGGAAKVGQAAVNVGGAVAAKGAAMSDGIRTVLGRKPQKED